MKLPHILATFGLSEKEKIQATIKAKKRLLKGNGTLAKRLIQLEIDDLQKELHALVQSKV